MKKNEQIITGAVITAVAAGATAFFLWRKNRKKVIMETENDAQYHPHELPERNPINKHLTNVFHNAKAAINGSYPIQLS